MIKRVFIYCALSLALLGITAGFPAYGDAFLDDMITRIDDDMTREHAYSTAEKKLTMLAGKYPDDARIALYLGIAEYGLMNYGEALGHFRKAGGAHLTRRERNLAKFAVSHLEANHDMLELMGRINNTGMAGGVFSEKTTNETLLGLHSEALTVLTKEKIIYPALVLPHVVWIQKNFPDFPFIDGVAGDIYFSSMKYELAKDNYSRALEKKPASPLFNERVADCMVAQGDFDGAEEFYDRAIQLYRAGGTADSEAGIKRLSAVRGALPRKHADLDLMIREGKYSEAERVSQHRIALNPGDIAAITQLGNVYWEIGKRRTAISLYRKVTKIAPEYPYAHLFLGKAYIYENKYDKALKEFGIFRKNMESLPAMDEETKKSYIRCLHYIAHMNSTMKDYASVENQCGKILELDPEDRMAHFNLAISYYNYRHNRRAAYNELKAVIDIDPDSDIADQARFLMEYIRSNPDNRFTPDFSFLYRED
ncbi:MAG: tetratricopeptide repeat protein [Candidatus Omnitrophota bacterium]